MKTPVQNFIFAVAILAFCCTELDAQYVNEIGLTLLQSVVTNANGSGIRVGQVEAAVDTNGDWELSPADMPLPVSVFTYYSNGVSSSTYTNTLGGYSWHADNVGQCFYGPGAVGDGPGVATNVAHVDTAEANSYYDDVIAADSTLVGNVTDAVVNQSFSFGLQMTNEQETLDSQYDNNSVKYNTLFISAANNGGRVSPPGTSYNCISVGVYNGNSSYGPTIDNGRCKPDITAPGPGGDTSFSTPYVAGSAAVLMQAGWRGDGGSATNAAANMITVKALELNGAVKPADWTNDPPSPLDYRYGSGVLNVFNSYEELVGGKHVWSFSTNIPAGTAHPPVWVSSPIPALSGWDFNTNTSSASDDAVNHYVFSVTNNSHSASFTLTATLAWNRHFNNNFELQPPLGINKLALFLYNAANSNLVACSTSAVDNVQHLFVRQLPPGRYDLEAWKAGGGFISASEPYALAWAFVTQSLAVAQSGGNVEVNWPYYPAGYGLQAASSLNPPIAWSTNNVPVPTYANGQNVVTLAPTNGPQFFRLATPNF